MATVLLVIGSGIRCITSNTKYATPLIHLGQILIGFAGPVGQASATALSCTWFPANQRTTATAIGSLASYCGTAISFLAGPHLIQDYDKLHIHYIETDKLIAKLSKEIMFYLYIQLGICGLLFFLVLVSFPNKPPKPPSATANLERVDFLSGLKKLALNPQFQLIAFAYGLTTGVYSAWCSDLAINLNQFNIDDETAGFLGFWAVIAGAVSGISLSLYVSTF